MAGGRRVTKLLQLSNGLVHWDWNYKFPSLPKCDDGFYREVYRVLPKEDESPVTCMACVAMEAP